jgi:signal transduction histidine kinase
MLALLLACSMFVANEWAYQRAQRSLDSLGARTDAREATQLLMRRLLDAETATRGYLLTSRSEYLMPAAEVKRDLDRAMDRLHQHYRTDAELSQLVEDMAARTNEKLSELNETVSLHDQGKEQAWIELILTDIGREKMGAVRTAAEKLLAAESQRFGAERVAIYRTLDAGRLGVHAVTLLALMGLIFYLRKSAALQAAQRAHAHDMQLERDRLDSQVRLRTSELSELNRHLQSVREQERGRVARTLHDELGALLTTAKLDLARLRRLLGAPSVAVAERLAHLGITIDQGIGLKRRIMEDLMPSMLHNLGLREALESLAGEFSKRTGVAIDLNLATIVAGEGSRIAAYRLVEGALSNIERHAHAATVHIQLRTLGPEIVVSVRDDGRGFDAVSAWTQGNALKNLRHRIEMLGGSMSVLSTPGRGTEVEAAIPTQSAADEVSTQITALEGKAPSNERSPLSDKAPNT